MKDDKRERAIEAAAKQIQRKLFPKVVWARMGHEFQRQFIYIAESAVSDFENEMNIGPLMR